MPSNGDGFWLGEGDGCLYGAFTPINQDIHTEFSLPVKVKSQPVREWPVCQMCGSAECDGSIREGWYSCYTYYLKNIGYKS